MTQVTVSNEYNVDAEKLWGKVKAFNDIDKYLHRVS